MKEKQVIMNMDRKHNVTNQNTMAKTTFMVARLCIAKVANRALRKGGQRFLY